MDVGRSHLPLEVLSLILSYLDITAADEDIRNSRDFKQVWLVCKAFSDAAAPFWLHKVRLSPQVKDWKQLAEISQHPILSKYVKEIEYDATIYGHKFFERTDYVRAILSNTTVATGLEQHSNHPWRNYLQVMDCRAASVRGHQEYQRRCLHQMNLSRHTGDHMPIAEATNLPSDLLQMMRASDVNSLRSFLPGDLNCHVEALRRMPNVDSLSIIASPKQDWSHKCFYWLERSGARSFLSYTVENRSVCDLESIVIDPTPWPATGRDAPRYLHHIWYRGFHLLTQATSMVNSKSIATFNVKANHGSRYGTSHRIFRMSPAQLYHACITFQNMTTIDLTLAAVEDLQSGVWEEARAVQDTFATGNIARCLSVAKSLQNLSHALKVPFGVQYTSLLPY